MSQTRRRGLAERCFRSSLASEPAKVGLGPLGSGIVESRVSQALGWGEGGREESRQFLPCGPWGQTPTGQWQFPVVDHPPAPRTDSDSVCGWGGTKEESRSIRAGYLARSSIRAGIRMNYYGKGMLHSEASFILQLAQETCVLTVPFTNHPFCRLSVPSLKYGKLKI